MNRIIITIKPSKDQNFKGGSCLLTRLTISFKTVLARKSDLGFFYCLPASLGVL